MRASAAETIRPVAEPCTEPCVEPGVELGELLDALPSLVAFVDRDGTSRYANRAARAWLGREPHELEGRSVREVIGEEQYAVVRHHVHAALLGSHVSFERTMVLPRGTVVVALTQYLPHFRGQQPDGFTMLLTDVTRQVLAEAASAAGRRRVEELVRQNQRAAVRTDDVLQELFAISLHLERMRRAHEEDGHDRTIDAVAGAIDILRATVKQLTADGEADARGPEPPRG